MASSILSPYPIPHCKSKRRLPFTEKFLIGAPQISLFGIITKGFADENSPNYMSVGTMKFLDVTLNLKDIKEALKTMDFKDDRLKIYIKHLTEQIRTDEIYNPDGTFRDD